MHTIPNTIIAGLQADTAKIADGVYTIICRQGQQSIVAVGMLPADICEMLERLVREKLITLAARQAGLPEAAYAAGVDAENLNDLVRELTKEIHSGIYAAADRANAMLC